ncbi:MAG: alkaline phosphatase [Puniceicoccaceae bacterium]
MRFSLLLLLLAATLNAQHDPGRNSMRLIASGDVDEAIELVTQPPNPKNSPIDEAELNFVLTMAACEQGDVRRAFRLARKAVKEGLPTERLQAGPREILQPLYDYPWYKLWIRNKEEVLLHGPMVGSVTDASASFWVRTAEEAMIEVWVWEATKVGVKSKRSNGIARTMASKDFTTVVQVGDLEPETLYRYEVLVNGKSAGATAEFKTFPLQGTAAQFTVGFGGGAGFTPQYERMWTTVDQRNLDALLLLGDNVYIDDPEHEVSQQYCYYRRQSQERWRKLVGTVNVATIYDDHDFGMNDCIPGPEINVPYWKPDVWEVFSQNWANPSYGGGENQPGCWYDFYIGDVHFIMLDCRYYRDLDGGSMLGPVQKKWFLDTLKNSKGTFKVLASSVPWSPGVKPKSKDTWDGFAAEREEIFSFIEKEKIDGVLLMAADRHRTDMRRIPRQNGYDLLEVMSSRLTNVHTHDLIEDAEGSEFIMGYNEMPSFGHLAFDTEAADPVITFSMINIDDTVIDSRKVKLSELAQ